MLKTTAVASGGLPGTTNSGRLGHLATDEWRLVFFVFGVDPKITFFVPWALLQVQSSLQSFTEVKVVAIKAVLVTV